MLPYNASPKAISRRTSYLQVRLAFHRYPQVIRACCNALRYGPPPRYYRGFSLPMDRSLGFGSNPYNFGRPIQARFHCASVKWLRLAHAINSLDRSTKSTPSPRRAPTPCTHTISGSISLPFRGSFNLSLTVLVHYRSQNIFSLGTWSSQLQSGFLVSRPTRQNKYKVSETWHTGLSPSLAELSNSFCSPR